PRSVVAADDDNLLEVRCLLARLEHLRELRRVLHDDRPRPGVVHDVGDQIWRIRRIDRDRHAACREDREVGLDPFGPAPRKERDRVAFTPPERQETERHLAHDLAYLAPRDRLPTRALLELLGRTAGAPLDPFPEKPR